MQKLTIDNKTYSFEFIPDECPHCHKSIHPKYVSQHGYNHEDVSFMDLILSCPNRDCQKAFITTYEYLGNDEFEFHSTSTGTLKKHKFSKEINKTSPIFSKIYNQSIHAEQKKLMEICGVGYRKSLEFLIKDYAIFRNPEKKGVIEKQSLSICINNYVTDSRIIKVAKRATWLGNDETHYVRKWEGKNLTDLKKLIELTVHWIEMDLLTDSFEEEMPENKT